MASTNEVADKNNIGYDGQELEPDDPNYAYQKQASKYMELYEEMPEGWIKNDYKDKNYKAPYIHPSTGRECWQHPNRPKMDEVTKEINKEVTSIRVEAPSKHQRSLIKKLRMMLQNGIPRGAVEQRAKLEGVDMAYVLGERNLDESDSDDEKKASESDNSESNDPFMKKYRRMIKSGVPWRGVKNTVILDGRWKPEQVEMALSSIIFIDENKPISTATSEKEKEKNKAEHIQHEEKKCSDSANKFFTPIQDGKKISFEASSTSELCSLVRRMAQTIQKTSSNFWTTVDSLTLYNALGSLKGVQVARDAYNSTTNDKGLSFQEIRGKRQAFGEIARSIGMRLPKSLTERVTIEGLDELVTFVEKTYEKELMERKAKLDDGLYDFDSFAMLYPPGSKVVAKNAGGGGIDMMCQVAWNRFEQGRTITGEIKKYFKVCFQFVVAVGSSHATIAETVEGMESFQGSRHMKTALTFVPMIAYSKEEQERLTAQYRYRGELYNQVALCGKHAYMAYDKGSFFLKRGGSNSRGNSAAALATGGRIIVDTKGAYDYGHSLGTGYDNMVTGIKYKYKEYSLHLRSVKQDQKNNGTNGGTATYADDTGLILFDKVPNDYLEMVWPMVVGFSLTAKAWGDVLVDGLEQIKFQENIFNHLVLSEKRKMMVKALVRHSSSSNNTFCDLVEGKGEGTVFLLYGPPGVGKTLTAEAVAELLHKPLYSVSMGSLGTTPSELEERMGQIMTMSSTWDSLILLDEADSFLETRSSTASSLERNAMVSVMLKLVEYFSGILFLTSNRIDSLDPAFQTRITLALRYDQLNQEARAQVWKNLLTKSGFDDAVAKNEINPDALSTNPLNGREIKNALRLAMAMAAEMQQSISQDILLETIEIINDYKTVPSS